jgi:predicted Rossmann-fold nucleotide-binding protein
MRRVGVYCGSSDRVDPMMLDAARAFGALLASRGVGTVYGGGRVGLMGALADGALAAGGEVLGVIPEQLMAHELGHEGCTELFVVAGMHARKMEELFEVLTWTQLELHRKPVGLLDVGGYYHHLRAWVAHAVASGFVRPLHAELLVCDDDPARLLDRLATVDLPGIDAWIRDR